MQKSLNTLKKELKSLGNPEKAQKSARFFKTDKGHYGEGDVFLGVTLPEQRKLVKQYRHLPLEDLIALLQSPEHEFRMTALLILVAQFKKGTEKKQQEIYALYLHNTTWVNNWDLVDSSAEYIVGPWLENKPDKRLVLKKLAQSESLWERRIAMLATFCYIKKGNSKEALEIALILLHDKEDLIQKAVGWMLREVGKRCSMQIEEDFLKKHYQQMPRTMLLYAIERFPETQRKAYLRGEIG